MSIFTARLLLRPVDEDEARRIHERTPAPHDRWAADFPFDGDLVATGALLRAMEQHGDPAPFGHYVIHRHPDGEAIGGIGFKGPPSAGAAEVGYGLVPSARGRGLATEALRAIVDLARGFGVRAVRADTELDNGASQRVLEKAGFRLLREDDEARFFEIELRPSSSADDR